MMFRVPSPGPPIWLRSIVGSNRAGADAGAPLSGAVDCAATVPPADKQRAAAAVTAAARRAPAGNVRNLILENLLRGSRWLRVGCHRECVSPVPSETDGL